MSEPTQAAAAQGQRYLTFRLDDRLYAVPASEVSEVIRIPASTRVPQAPRSLIGIANLRGSVLPLTSLRGLLGGDERVLGSAARAIVLDGPSPVGLAVDGVEDLVDVDGGRIETRQAELAAEPGEILSGAFPLANGVARILDVQALLTAAFARRDHRRRQAANKAAAAEQEGVRPDERRMLVTFEVAGQEFGLDLDAVREILPAPSALATAPRAESLVLGVAAYRDSLLPLLSLRGLLGFPIVQPTDDLQKVVVTKVGGVLVGLVADRMRSILAAEPDLIGPTPAVLAARAGGETVISHIYRGEGGRRLVSILEPPQLFRQDVVQRLEAGSEAVQTLDAPEGPDSDAAVRFVVFRLGDDEYGLPVAAVDEVALVPDRITRVPKTPKFLEGVINLRGEVLPVIDQRRRFDLPAADAGARRRLMVVRTQDHRAGLIVDSVSEVLRSDPAAIDPGPALTDDAAKLIRGVVNLEHSGRMILILDPDELLSRAEHGLLAKFEASAERAAL